MSHLAGVPVLGSSGFAKVPLQKQAAMSSSQTPVHFPVAFGPGLRSLHDAGSPCATEPELHPRTATHETWWEQMTASSQEVRHALSDGSLSSEHPLWDEY